MKQTSQPFAYEQLRSLSFTDLFQLFFMIARRIWFRNLEWANESDDRLSSQPPQAARFPYSNEDGSRGQLVNGERQKHSCAHAR